MKFLGIKISFDSEEVIFSHLWLRLNLRLILELLK